MTMIKCHLNEMFPCQNQTLPILQWQEFGYKSMHVFVLYEMLKTSSNFNINTTDISCIIYNESFYIWCLPLLLLTDSHVQHSVQL